jgi:hypothetical protein
LIVRWCERVVLVAMLGGASIGFAWLGVLSTAPSRLLKPDDEPGSGVIARTEIVSLWLPEPLIDLAAVVSPSSAPRTHLELRAILERRGQTEVWYALTARGHQIDGGAADITLIRRPYHDAEHFEELLNILAAADGQTTSSSTRYAGAELHIVPTALAAREPRKAIEALSRRLSRRPDGRFGEPPARER